MREPLPLATVHDAVLEFLRGRNEVVVFGATAVNAYVDEPRMTQDIDLMSLRAAETAEDLRTYLGERFHIAVRVRVIGGGKGYRVFQVQKTGNRDLVDIRPVASLPSAELVEGVRVISPAELIAWKVISYHSRRGNPRGFLDMRDLTSLLLAFPKLKTEDGQVSDVLRSLRSTKEVMAAWRDVVKQKISQLNEDSEFD